MLNKFVVCLVVVLGVCPLMATAGSAEEVAKISEEIALLQARLKKIEVETQISQKQADRAKFDAQAGNGSQDGMPTVRGAEGFAGRMQATLALEDGRQITVTRGDVLPNGWKVEQVASNGVVVSKGGKSKRLPFGADPISNQGGQNPSVQGGSAIPPLPMR